MSRSWHIPREGPKKNVKPSGPHKQKDRNPEIDYYDEYGNHLDCVDCGLTMDTCTCFDKNRSEYE